MGRRIYLEVGPFRGYWQIKVDRKLIATRLTQTEAIVCARQYVTDRLSYGLIFSLRIKRPDGTIREERTYPRGSDPRRTKG